MKLIIGNKKYSSWSFRPWIAMRVKGIAFEEELIPFDFAAGNPAIRAATPAGKVPVLVDGDLAVWESLAILEYLAERFPEVGLLPEDIAARARARSMAHEMHGGFGALRSECPMNMAREVRPIAVSDGVRRDVARIEQLWSEALSASGGPFLFGEFSNVDAMFAPVVNRLEIYALSTHEAVARYSAAMKALPAWAEWAAAGRAEPWIVEQDEA
ncbi:glutathione S-transferase family protein [Sinisalibacter lacisalsi]|uniref:Glutathione S-transferase n=1 Tax=Sinisalibacter lacisalsi TaxID=1526570 RepID=A0ABQ1QNM7_9RHOB|nr:glutathione S-transferase family protein [Sinisalibacter lacisalsi]GGD37118.1 glutathione S-transferase [Sinisalibacter lacisalsi]